MEMVLALLKYYSFDLGGYTVADLARAWQRYDSEWVRHAVIECLYRGRYKAVSVHQILQQWTRRGEPLYHYGKDFERFICHDVPLQMRQASDNLLYFSNQSPVTESLSGDSASPSQAESSTSQPNPDPTTTPSKSNARSTMGRRSGGRRYPERQNPPTAQPHQSLPTIEPRSYRNDVYSSALEDMRLLAKASIFTNKLRSMCQDQEPSNNDSPVSPAEPVTTDHSADQALDQALQSIPSSNKAGSKLQAIDLPAYDTKPNSTQPEPPSLKLMTGPITTDAKAKDLGNVDNNSNPVEANSIEVLADDNSVSDSNNRNISDVDDSLQQI